MAAKNGEKLNFDLMHRILLKYPVGQNLLEMALSLLVTEIFTIFYFQLKSKMASKSGENEIFFFCKG